MGVEEHITKEYNIKPMKCELNVLSKSDGSAILSQGDTVSMVSVNGPLDVKMQNQSIDKSNLEVLFCSKGGKPSVADRYKEHVIRQTCETVVLGSLYPRTGITITVQELEDYGGLLACCLNCACLALLNVGVAMRHVFAAVSCCVRDDGEITMCVGGEGVKATLCFVFDSRDKSLVTAFTEGSFGEDTYKEALEKCRASSDVVFTFYRDIVRKYSDVIG